jgi:hypothetical protein
VDHLQVARAESLRGVATAAEFPLGGRPGALDGVCHVPGDHDDVQDLADLDADLLSRLLRRDARHQAQQGHHLEGGEPVEARRGRRGKPLNQAVWHAKPPFRRSSSFHHSVTP